jgi:ribosomal protein S27AE
LKRRTIRTEKRHTLTAPPDDMCQQFKGRIICGRCGNSDWSKFTYMLPLDGRVLVQCSHCGLTFFKSMDADSYFLCFPNSRYRKPLSLGSYQVFARTVLSQRPVGYQKRSHQNLRLVGVLQVVSFCREGLE